MEFLPVGICLIVYISVVEGQCDIANCIQSDANPLFSTCRDYIRTLDCMRTQYNSCTGQAGRSEIMLSVRALSQPSDCAMDVQTMASSMSARSSMMNSMMQRTPPGAFPPGAMPMPMPMPMPNNPFFPSANGTMGLGMPGMMPMFPMMGDDIGEMEMELPEPGEGMSEMWEDMMESGMMPMPGMMFPGMMGGAAGGEGMEGFPSFPGFQQPGAVPAAIPGSQGRGPSKSKFVFYGNASASNKYQAMEMFWAVFVVVFLSFM